MNSWWVFHRQRKCRMMALTNWSKHVLCNKWPQSGMWHGYRDVCISPKHTGQFERDTFSTHYRFQGAAEKKTSTQSLIGNLILQDKKNTLTRCPFVFNCNGKHILHTWQWKKLLRPPIRQIPHPSQWYWSLSSSSNRLQIKHVYCKSPEKWSFWKENGQKWHISL